MAGTGRSEALLIASLKSSTHVFVFRGSEEISNEPIWSPGNSGIFIVPMGSTLIIVWAKYWALFAVSLSEASPHRTWILFREINVAGFLLQVVICRTIRWSSNAGVKPRHSPVLLWSGSSRSPATTSTRTPLSRYWRRGYPCRFCFI